MECTSPKMKRQRDSAVKFTTSDINLRATNNVDDNLPDIEFIGDPNKNSLTLNYCVSYYQDDAVKDYFNTQFCKWEWDTGNIAKIRFKLLTDGATTLESCSCHYDLNVTTGDQTVTAPQSGWYRTYKWNVGTGPMQDMQTFTNENSQFNVWVENDFYAADKETDLTNALAVGLSSGKDPVMGYVTLTQNCPLTTPDASGRTAFIFKKQGDLLEEKLFKINHSQNLTMTLPSFYCYNYQLGTDTIGWTRCNRSNLANQLTTPMEPEKYTTSYYLPKAWRTINEFQSLNNYNSNLTATQSYKVLEIVLARSNLVPHAQSQSNKFDFFDAMGILSNLFQCAWDFFTAIMDSDGNIVPGPSGPQFKLLATSKKTVNPSPVLLTHEGAVVQDTVMNGELVRKYVIEG